MAAAGGSWSKGRFVPAKDSQQAPTALSAPDRDPVSQQYFTQQNITVHYGPSGKLALEDILQKPITDQEVMQLTGAPNGSNIRVLNDNGRAYIKIEHPLYTQNSIRILDWDAPNQQVVLINDRLTLQNDTPTGFGTRLFATQVRSAEALGIDRIDTSAGGGPGDSYNGYYTWPRLGYKGVLKDSDRIAAAQALSVSVSDIPDTHRLFQVPGGSQWWKSNGSTIDASFDPRKGSTSRQVLDAYLDYKGYKL